MKGPERARAARPETAPRVRFAIAAETAFLLTLVPAA
jgi:hypothetical protein